MSKESMFVEKRVSPRVPIQLPVKYRLIEDPMGIGSISEMRKKEIASQTRDASLGGMFISADEKLNVGSIMSINFTLPEVSSYLSAFAEVVWSNNNGGGIHFLALKDEDMNTLKNTLTKVSSRR